MSKAVLFKVQHLQKKGTMYHKDKPTEIILKLAESERQNDQAFTRLDGKG